MLRMASVLFLAGLASSASIPAGKQVFCHVSNWARYRPGEGRFLPQDLDPDLCTNVIYSYAGIDGDTWQIKCVQYITFLFDATTLLALAFQVYGPLGRSSSSRGDGRLRSSGGAEEEETRPEGHPGCGGIWRGQHQVFQNGQGREEEKDLCKEVLMQK